jgi:signal transduction histidine kinase/CHASE2 domain-containing sensor protein
MPDQTAKRRARRTTVRQQRPFAEWAWVSAFLVVLAAVIGWQNGLNHLELSYFDWVLAVEARPANSDIVLIAVDDLSVAKLGPWPFAPDVQARFFHQLTQAQPRAIGVVSPLGNTSLTTDSVASDPVAAEIASNGHVALNSGPFGTEPGRNEVATSHGLLSAAAATGSALQTADLDGRVRRAALSGDVRGSPDSVPHFVTAVLQAAHMPIDLPGRRSAEVDGGPTGSGDHWVLIPYSGPAGNYQPLSYFAVQSGAVPASKLAGKLVLVGGSRRSSTTRRVPAFGLSEFGDSRMSPLEINANLLAGLLEGRSIVPLTAAANALGCAIPVVLAMLLLLLRVRRALLAVVAIALATLALSVLLMPLANLWFAPGGALAGLALALPLWRWRQLESDAARTGAILERIEATPDHYAEATLGPVEAGLSKVEQRLQALSRTVYRVSELRYYVDHIIESLPHSTLITNADGHVVAANRQARNYFASLGNTRLDGAQLPYLLGLLTLEGSAEGKSWWDIMDVSVANPQARARDVRNRDLLVRATAWHCINGDIGGWIASIEDTSAVRALERRRNEALQFMSETVVTAHRSILNVLDALEPEELDDSTRVAVASASLEALALTEKFIELSNAESRDYAFAVSDVNDAIELAVDGAYSHAGERGIHLQIDKPIDPILADIDMLMLSRALSVLINNALRFSQEHETVQIDVLELGGEAVFRVIDQGCGIAPLQQARMLRGLQPVRVPGGAGPVGSFGLGLSLVKIVAERHHGRLEFTSNPGQGSEFRIIVPAVKVAAPQGLPEQEVQ